MSKIAMMMTLLVGSCLGNFDGDFCDLGEEMRVKKEASARYLLEHERELLVKMNVQNKMLDKCPNRS